MKNPNGPYPGRQLFLGLTADSRPAFAYLVTGRSPQSRERKATRKGNSIIMGPIGNQPYDPLRHYTAIKCDNATGLAAISNGIQTEAIFETYRLIFHTGSLPGRSYVRKLLDGARAEPDSYRTPRIAGIITKRGSKAHLTYLISIKIHNLPAQSFSIDPLPGTLTGISTYNGSMENPRSFDTSRGLPKVEFPARTPEELANFIYDISAADYQGDDIRVCAIGGIRSDDGRTWELALVNRHKG